MLPFEGGLTGTENGTLLFSLLFSISYLFYGQRRNSTGRVTAKTASVAFLALLSLLTGAPLLLTVALVLCAAGDFFLAIEDRGPHYFEAGLGAFLQGHLVYVALFLSMPAAEDALPFALLVVVGAGILAIAGYMAPRLWRAAGPLRIPVMVYIAAILAMGIAALTTGSALVVAGAVSFIVSDTILASERFLLKEGVAKQFAGPAVWITYYAAQVLILFGVLTAL